MFRGEAVVVIPAGGDAVCVVDIRPGNGTRMHDVTILFVCSPRGFSSSNRENKKRVPSNLKPVRRQGHVNCMRRQEGWYTVK